MTDQPEKLNAWMPVVCFFVVLWGILFFIFYTIPQFEQSHPKSTMVPCEKIVTATEKHSVLTNEGLEHMITVNGIPMTMDNSWGLPGASGTYEKIPINTTMLIYGNPEAGITNFAEVKNVTKIAGTDCVNCCHVEYVK
jgi:hypothetical protein